MFSVLRNRNFAILLFADACLLAGAYFLAWFLRFDGQIPPRELGLFGSTVIWIVPVKLLSFFFFGLYKGMWRYTGIHDLKALTKACLAGSGIIVAVIFLTVRFEGFPRSIFPLDCFLSFFSAGAIRVGIRIYFHRQKKGSDRSVRITEGTQTPKRILIVGAGNAGEKILRELEDDPGLCYRPVGFVDDDWSKQGRALHRAPILGKVESAPELVKAYDVEEIFIAMPSATGEQMRRIVDVCKACGVKYRTLPGLGQLMDGRVSVKALRDVNYEDLLGRPPVQLSEEEIQRYVEGKRVLVTGAGGSIGSELCRQLVRFGPTRLIMVDASEPNLYAIQMEMEHEIRNQPYAAILGKVNMEGIMDGVMKRYAPQVVFHAAAYKHVPLLEENPWEAVFHNINGSRMVMEKAVQYGVERLVNVSTDKAVRPTNVMGASKRVAELVMQQLTGPRTSMMSVRFGNVVGSSGSVIPLFCRQIAAGGPVTVTHPEMTRYFMTIPEACQLILQAGTLGKGGEIFVLKMGTPVKILDMAMDLIRLFGKTPGQDIKIAFTGTRPGEKLYEELITEGEDVIATAHEKIMVLKGRNGNPPEETHAMERLTVRLGELTERAVTGDGPGIKRVLREIVPEYTSQDCRCVL